MTSLYSCTKHCLSLNTLMLLNCFSTEEHQEAGREETPVPTLRMRKPSFRVVQ